MGFYQAVVSGRDLFNMADQTLRNDVFLSMSNSNDDTATKLSDLQLVAYTTRRRQVKFEKQCKTNFGGEKVAGGMCV